MFAICPAVIEDAAGILALQKLAYQSEARLYDDWSLPPLTQTLESLHEEFTSRSIILKAVAGSRIVGSVRARVDDRIGRIGRLIVHPEFQGQGIGSSLLLAIERSCTGTETLELFTGTRSAANIRLYRRHGYSIVRTQPVSATVTLAFMEKSVDAA